MYADEADMLNVAMFGKTAMQWRKDNPNAKGNIRDYATISQLLVLANLESYNAILIEQGVEQEKRLELLRRTVIKQLTTISQMDLSLIKLQKGNPKSIL